MLNLARALQGVGGAFMFATVAGAARRRLPAGRDRGTAFGVWGATTGAAVAVGPLVGGVLTDGDRLGGDLLRQRADRHRARSRSRCAMVDESRDPTGGRRSTGPGLVTFSGALFVLVFGLIRGNAEGWGSPLIVVLPRRRGRAAGRLRGRSSAACEHPMLDLDAVPQARVRRRVDRRVRAVGVDVRDVPLPDALHPEHPRLLAARGRPALPADHAAVVRRRADLRQARRAPRRALVPRRRARARRRRAAADARPAAGRRLDRAAGRLHRRRRRHRR